MSDMAVLNTDIHGLNTYLAYMQLNEHDDIYSMYQDSYMTRFLGIPQFRYDQILYSVEENTAGEIGNFEFDMLGSSSLEGTLREHNTRINRKPKIRGYLNYRIKKKITYSAEQRDAYAKRATNPYIRYPNGQPAMTLDMDVYFKLRRYSALLIDHFAFSLLAGSVPVGTWQTGKNLGSVYEQNGSGFIQQPSALTLQALPHTRFVPVNFESYTNRKVINDIQEFDGAHKFGQGLTLGKINLALQAFKKSSIDDGQYVCIIPESCKIHLEMNPQFSDLTQKYIANATPLEGLPDVIQYRNVLLVFLPDDRFPRLSSMQACHFITDAPVPAVTAIQGLVTTQNVNNFDAEKLQYAYMLKMQPTSGFNAPVIDWGIKGTAFSNRDYLQSLVGTNSADSSVVGPMYQRLYQLGLTNGFLVQRIESLDEDKTVKYLVDDKIVGTRLRDEGVVVIEIYDNIIGNAPALAAA